MKTILYLSQVSACTGIFFLFYYTCLRKFTFFKLNRWYLLLTLGLSFIIPSLTIPVQQAHNLPIVKQVVYVNKLQHVPTDIMVKPLDGQQTFQFTWPALVKWCYYGAVALLALQVVMILAGFFFRLKRKARTLINGVTVVHGNKDLPNGSFLNYIFLNEEALQPEEVQQIIAHEMLHVKLLHSVDRIMVKTIQIILWFNPFVYLYARCIEENHEFEVDNQIASTTDKNQYASLLLNLCISNRQPMLYNSFSQSPLKNRITMLFNQPTTNMKKLIYVMIIPVMMSCLAFSQLKSTEDKPVSAINGVDKLGKNPIVLIDGKSYTKEILYRISPACIKGTILYNAYSDAAISDDPAKDGKVEITTTDGKITYLTAIERENLITEAAVPVGQLYSRIRLKKEDGSSFDKVIIQIPGTKLSSTYPTEVKAKFSIDGKIYTENEFSKLSPEIVNSLTTGTAKPGSVNTKPGTQDNDMPTIFILHKKS